MADEGYDEVDAVFGNRQNLSSQFRDEQTSIRPVSRSSFKENEKQHSPRTPVSNHSSPGAFVFDFTRQDNADRHESLGFDTVFNNRHFSKDSYQSAESSDDELRPRCSGRTRHKTDSTAYSGSSAPALLLNNISRSTGFLVDEGHGPAANVQFGLFDTSAEKGEEVTKSGNSVGTIEHETEQVIVPSLLIGVENVKSILVSTDTEDEEPDKEDWNLNEPVLKSMNVSPLHSAGHSRHSMSSGSSRESGKSKRGDTPPRLLARGMGTRINRSINDLPHIHSDTGFLYKDRLALLSGDRKRPRSGSLQTFSVPNLLGGKGVFGSTKSLKVAEKERGMARSDIISRDDYSFHRNNSTKSLLTKPSTCRTDTENLSRHSLRMPVGNVENELCFAQPECESASEDESESVELRTNNVKPEGCCRGVWWTIRRFSPTVFPILSGLLFLADIGTDLRLAWHYKYKEGRTDLFAVTLAFILVPSLIMAVVDLTWYFLDRRNRREKLPDKREDESTCFHVFRIAIGALSFGRVYRSFTHVYHYVMTLKQSRPRSDHDFHRHRSMEEKRDYYMLDFINAFTESAPQLLVQLVMLYKYDLDLIVDRVLSLLSSWVSIAWTFAAYYRCNREALHDKENLSTVGFVFVLFAQLSAFTARFASIALFATYFTWWVAVVLGSHFVLMIAWTFYQRPPMDGIAASKFGKGLFKLFFSYVQCISFVNLRESTKPARYRMTAFYILFYVENFVMAGLVFWYLIERGTDAEKEKMYNLVMLPVGMGLHFWFNIVYYWKCHPSVKLNRNSVISESPENGEIAVPDISNGDIELSPLRGGAMTTFLAESQDIK